MRYRLLAITMLLCGAFVAPPADAAVTVVVVNQASRTAGSFATPVVVMPAGGPLTYVNGDVQPHGLASQETGADNQAWCTFYATGRCPLLWAPVTDAGFRTNAVRGLAATTSGATYHLYCVLHPTITGLLLAV
jgi:hypothetical protein